MNIPHALRRSTLLLIALCLFACGEEPASSGDVTFTFDDWAGPAITVNMYVPEAADASTPIVFVMHGASRDLPRYYADWRIQGEERGFIVVVPYFSKEHFATAARYNLGHVFDPDTGKRRKPSEWTFAAIEPLFDGVVDMTASTRESYTLFGHSAGSQFVHRFLYYVPEARASRVIAANAGWYTMPDFGVDWPYGLADSGVPEDVLADYLSRELVVLLGDADTDRTDDNLRKTPEAELQGQHRFDRGQTFFRAARARAEELGVDFGWQLQTVPGAAHSNAQMTPAAAELVR